MQRIASSAQGAGWLVSTDMHRKRVKTRDNRQPNGLTMTQAVAKVVHFVTGADGDGDGEEYGQFATKVRQRMRPLRLYGRFALPERSKKEGRAEDELKILVRLGVLAPAQAANL